MEKKKKKRTMKTLQPNETTVTARWKCANVRGFRNARHEKKSEKKLIYRVYGRYKKKKHLLVVTII